MNLKVIRAPEQITSAWSGGTTTQLYIFPEDSSYQERNFLFRISTATIESEESTFTSLPGVSRWLMVLQGVLTIDHRDRYTRMLQKFDTDSFCGLWETKSIGKVKDFNLMTTGDLPGTVSGIILKNKETYPVPAFPQGNTFTGLYVLKGRVKIFQSGIDAEAGEGDFMAILPAEISARYEILSLDDTEFAIAQVNLSQAL